MRRAVLMIRPLRGWHLVVRLLSEFAPDWPHIRCKSWPSLASPRRSGQRAAERCLSYWLGSFSIPRFYEFLIQQRQIYFDAKSIIDISQPAAILLGLFVGLECLDGCRASGRAKPLQFFHRFH